MKTIFAFFILVFSSCQINKSDAVAYDLSGKVIRIADGDTFTLLTDKKEQVKIRMHGIDCPERGQDFGQVARQHLSDLIFNKTVFIKTMDTDRYGRIVAIVFDEQKLNINEALLKNGMAWHYTEYDNNSRWSQLERQARRNKAGLWSQPNPTPPWQWRKEK